MVQSAFNNIDVADIQTHMSENFCHYKDFRFMPHIVDFSLNLGDAVHTANAVIPAHVRKRAIEEYIPNKLTEDIANDRITLKEYIDTFGRKNQKAKRAVA